MARPFVSVVMPVYNGGEYFRLAVESVLRQTYSNYEIVIVNDGSRDDGHTDRICRGFASAHPGKVRYYHQKNGGVASALNTGIANMSGDIFCWLSHDDIYEPNKLQRQVEYFQALGKADAMIFSDYSLIDSAGNHREDVRFDHLSFVRSPQLPLFRGCINGCAVFIPKANLPNPAFDTRNRYAQDYHLWLDLQSKYEFFHLPEVLVRYRVHESNDTKKPDATAEGEAVWRRMVDSTSEEQRVQLYGSSWKFYDETIKIMMGPPYPEMIGYLTKLRDECIANTLVSVVIPFYNEVQLTQRAVHSVLAQSHSNVEILLIDDGSTESIGLIMALAESDDRIRLIRQANAGPAAARNAGIAAARGEYIAFLDCDDQFFPTKIETQLRSMQTAGALVSHTSYYVSYPGRGSGMGRVSSGTMTGSVYPAILSMCSVCPSTVMLHRLLRSSGALFPSDMRLSEDTLVWINLAARYDLLGIDQPLTIMEWTDTTAAICLEKTWKGLHALIDALTSDPIHSRHPEHIANLRTTLETVREALAGGSVNEQLLAQVMGPRAVLSA